MGLLRVHEEYVDAFVAVKRQEAIGQDSLFGAFGDDSAGDSGGDLMGLTAVPGVPGDAEHDHPYEVRIRCSGGSRARCRRGSGRASGR